MKMNKEQFLKTEFGGELESTITAWDDALSRNREDKEVLRTLAWCQAQWEVYRMAIKHFYGVEYHFTRSWLSTPVVRRSRFRVSIWTEWLIMIAPMDLCRAA